MMKNKYTIIEMMVVVGIIAIVIGLGLPAFNQMINGGKVQQAARQLSTALMQARSEAIVTGRKVALVFPSRKPAGTKNDHIKNRYANASYGIIVMDKEGTAIDLNKNQEFKWKLLPYGTIICLIDNAYPATPTSTTPYFSATHPYTDLTANISVDNSDPFSRAITDATQMKVLYFNPDGTVDGELDFFITEGFVINSSGNLQATNVNTANANRPNNTIRLKLNRFTGKVTYEEEL